jgi:hypothetical protein
LAFASTFEGARSEPDRTRSAFGGLPCPVPRARPGPCPSACVTLTFAHRSQDRGPARRVIVPWRSSRCPSSSAVARHFEPDGVRRARIAAPRSQATCRDQEQIQMIATAIGIPKPSAPKIAGTNSDSRRTPDDDMTLLLGAPRASARPQDERSIAPSNYGPWRLLMGGNVGALWLTRG